MRAPFLFALMIGVMGWSTSAPAQIAEKRVALVIGNAAYKDATLLNPVNDARAMAARLRGLGFQVVARENATRQAMGAAIGEFTGKLTPGSVALIYYAGHGVQSRGRNYLLPVDTQVNAESDLAFQGVDVGLLTAELEQAQSRVSILILDACRNNPFERRMRGASPGLAAVDAASGTLIAYATAPGSVAADGAGKNGVYTSALLSALSVPNLKAEEVFKRVRVEVSEQTRRLQMPWESSSLTGDFIFNSVAALPPAAPASVQADREALFWQTVKDSRSADDFQDYLTEYPKGHFAGIARRRMAELKLPSQPLEQQALAPVTAPPTVSRPAAAPPHPVQQQASPPPPPAPLSATLPQPYVQQAATPAFVQTAAAPLPVAASRPNPPSAQAAPGPGGEFKGSIQCVSADTFETRTYRAVATSEGDGLKIQLENNSVARIQGEGELKEWKTVYLNTPEFRQVSAQTPPNRSPSVQVRVEGNQVQIRAATVATACNGTLTK